MMGIKSKKRMDFCSSAGKIGLFFQFQLGGFIGKADDDRYNFTAKEDLNAF